MENPCFLGEDFNLKNTWPTDQQLLNNCQHKQFQWNQNNYYNYYEKEYKMNQINIQNIMREQHGQLFIYPVRNSLVGDSGTVNGEEYSMKKPCGISIIYQPHCQENKCTEDVKQVIRSTKLKKEWCRCPLGWRLQFVENKNGTSTGKKIITFLCALFLATIITLLATGAVLHILQNGRFIFHSFS